MKEIYDYVKKQTSRETAHRVVRGIYDRTQVLIDFPEVGHRYERAHGRNVRTLLYGKYRIMIYRPI